MTGNTFDFTRSLPPARDFAQALADESFTPLPDDWFVAVTDVMESRRAIAEGRYKAVNMAGVTMISAAMNMLGSQDIPYIFGGDGAALALAPAERDAMARILARCVTFVAEELGLVLRAAIVPVSRLREDGLDVRVRLVRVSDALSNFAFAGGGLKHAEKLMKQGKYAVAAAASGARPDLSGLSCRWTPIRDEGRKIVSLILEPADGTSVRRFAAFERKLLAIAGDGGVNPMPSAGPTASWPPAGLELEARATSGGAHLGRTRLRLYLATLLGWFLFATGIRLGRFDPNRHRRYTTLNTDFRKIQDGLRMTLSLGEAEFDALRGWLENQREKGVVRVGICVQDSAVLTCYVPSVTTDTHFHFLDGAGGGYAEAASNLRGRTTATLPSDAERAQANQSEMKRS